jgi:thiamine pyrophosphate-dependent acetolactate synthase large subunit-like protein
MPMKVGEAIAEILKREGVEIIFGYPVNHVLEAGACLGIRPVIVRQERVGLHMADAMSRVSSGRKIGVFAMQHGPGSENAFGGVAQAYSESVPILVLPMGYPRRQAQIDPNFNSVASMRTITKSAESVTSPREVTNIFRRAFSRLRNGRGGPALVEIPMDLFAEDIPEPLVYEPVISTRYGPDIADVRRAAAALAEAKFPVIYAGQEFILREPGSRSNDLPKCSARRSPQAFRERARFPKIIRCRSERAALLIRGPFFNSSRNPTGFLALAAASRKLRLASACRGGRSSFTLRSIPTT